MPLSEAFIPEAMTPESDHLDGQLDGNRVTFSKNDVSFWIRGAGLKCTNLAVRKTAGEPLELGRRITAGGTLQNSVLFALGLNGVKVSKRQAVELTLIEAEEGKSPCVMQVTDDRLHMTVQVPNDVYEHIFGNIHRFGGTWTIDLQVEMGLFVLGRDWPGQSPEKNLAMRAADKIAGIVRSIGTISA